MLTIFVLFVGSLATLVVLLLLVVAIGIHQEPRMEGLSGQAPTVTAAFVRRLIGVHVGKLDSPAQADKSGNGHASLLASSMDEPNLE